jgi:hypothetical protein
VDGVDVVDRVDAMNDVIFDPERYCGQLLIASFDKLSRSLIDN